MTYQFPSGTFQGDIERGNIPAHRETLRFFDETFQVALFKMGDRIRELVPTFSLWPIMYPAAVVEGETVVPASVVAQAAFASPNAADWEETFTKIDTILAKMASRLAEIKILLDSSPTIQQYPKKDSIYGQADRSARGIDNFKTYMDSVFSEYSALSSSMDFEDDTSSDGMRRYFLKRPSDVPMRAGKKVEALTVEMPVKEGERRAKAVKKQAPLARRFFSAEQIKTVRAAWKEALDKMLGLME